MGADFAYLVIQNVGVGRIGPVGLGGELFQEIRILADLLHQRNGDSVVVIGRLLIVLGHSLQHFMQSLAVLVQRIAGGGNPLGKIHLRGCRDADLALSLSGFCLI